MLYQPRAPCFQTLAVGRIAGTAHQFIWVFRKVESFSSPCRPADVVDRTGRDQVRLLALYFNCIRPKRLAFL